MPIYEYRCDATGRVVEVRHRMAERLATWGEVCERGGYPLEGIAADSPVTRLISAGNIVQGSRLRNPPAASPCAGGPCCGGGACQLE